MISDRGTLLISYGAHGWHMPPTEMLSNSKRMPLGIHAWRDSWIFERGNDEGERVMLATSKMMPLGAWRDSWISETGNDEREREVLDTTCGILVSKVLCVYLLHNLLRFLKIYYGS